MTIFVKSSYSDIWQSSEYVSESDLFLLWKWEDWLKCWLINYYHQLIKYELDNILFGILKRKKGMTFKLCQLTKSTKITQNSHGLVNNPKQPLKNKIFWDKINKNYLKIFSFFFRTSYLIMGKIMKNKTGLELGISRSSGHKTSSESNKVVFESVQNLHLIVFASQLITS